jgi:MurNAc alpha-1-phosphate uridylyltransferase
MPDSVAAVVLGAGAGTRLRPLTNLRPKVLCPVGGVPLVDLAIARVAAVTPDVAVNVHHGRDALVAHLDGRVHVSIEADVALGTAGGVAHLRGWLDGRAVLVVNGDTWTTVDLAPLVAGWDGDRVRVFVTGDDATLGPRSGIAGSLLPPWAIAELPESPSGLFEVCWKPAEAVDRLEVVAAGGPFIPVDRPADYLRANLAASSGASVVGEGAVVDGSITRCVVWDGAVVRPGEVLVDAIRCTGRTTVLVR